MEKEAVLHYLIKLIGFSLRKRKRSRSITWENFIVSLPLSKSKLEVMFAAHLLIKEARFLNFDMCITAFLNDVVIKRLPLNLNNLF